MKKITLMVIVLSALCLQLAYAQGFTLKSDAFGGQLSKTQEFSGFGCSGKNISPSLKWMDAPENTKSFAVTVYDPDAPTGSGWWHWLIFNIPAETSELKTDAGNVKQGLSPKGSVQSINDYGLPGFGGACPPVGDKPHRYVFTVYALDVASLNLDAKTLPPVVGFTLNQHTLARATLIAYFGRQK
ncbi:MAG: YbhB/YbcL family Raf kinase inhibitor-like protein [Desulfosarcinaceae bacterium]